MRVASNIARILLGLLFLVYGLNGFFRFGYGVSQRIQQISKDVLQVQQGSLYPALHRLEKCGWLETDWGESENGRQAKFYKLSLLGRKQFAMEEASWKRLSEAVALVLRTAR